MKIKNGEHVFELDVENISNNKNIKVPSNFDIIRSKGVYYFGFIFNEIFNVIHSAKTLKTLDMTYDPEDLTYIEYIMIKEEYNTTYSVRELITCPKNRSLEVGSVCTSEGGHYIAKILAKNKYFYYIKIDKKNNLANKKIENKYLVVFWNDVFPISNKKPFEYKLSPIRYYNSTLSSLYDKLFNFGIDMNPEYQRGAVWIEDQEIKLIDSIFNNINIGSFVFAEKIWADKKTNSIIGNMFEIVDGKQRLSAILHYIEGKFKYRGLYYHELNPSTRIRFNNTCISVGEIQFGGDEYDKKLVLETFIRLNECGTSMNKNVINKAKELI